jgi:hypothetical protein
MIWNQQVFMTDDQTSMENLILDIRDWSINRFSKLTKKNQIENAIALEEEFSEWLTSDLDDDIEIMTLD